MPIITLTTDFGTRDGYVGALKGVIARRAPEATVVDLAHDIPPGDIAHAAWVVATSAPEFPWGTVHIVVVDPGVGGARRGVIASAVGQWYVAPDNGVLSYVTNRHTQAWAIDIAQLGTGVSRTFHGRDVFGPVAVSLALGEQANRWGQTYQLTGELPWGPRPERQGRVVHIDRFGNLITDLPRGEAGAAIAIAGHTIAMRGTYEDVPPGEVLAYIGSARTVEIAVRDGRADSRLAISRGTLVSAVKDAGPYR
jgi:S-adenosylmethionine hydrolase